MLSMITKEFKIDQTEKILVIVLLITIVIKAIFGAKKIRGNLKWVNLK